MIKYILRCSKAHEFESWFSNSEEFDKLNKKKLLECIYCSSKEVSKSIMAPRVSIMDKKSTNLRKLDKLLNAEKRELLKFRNFIEKNFENVGKNFSKEVRDIYYDKKNKRLIYGTTTQKEREELEDEGIDLLSVPWVSKDN